MTTVYKNFLPLPHYQVMRDLFLTEKLPWHFNDRVVSTERQFMFTHAFMDNGQLINPHFFEPVRAMLDLIQQKKSFIGVSRVKANLYTNQGKAIRHPAHFDIPPEAGVSDKVCIGVYHLNACNGYTIIGDRKIRSRNNQLVLFDNVSHYGTVQTDTDARVVINFNLRLRR
jgi:hypothetical protein